MCVKTRGGAGACSAVAETVSPVIGSRFFSRMLTTSTDVHAQSATSTASMGEGPATCSFAVSMVMVWPLSERPSKMDPFFHSALAIMDRSSVMLVVGGWLRMDHHAMHIRALHLESIFEFGDDLVDALHRHLVRQRAMA